MKQMFYTYTRTSKRFLESLDALTTTQGVFLPAARRAKTGWRGRRPTVFLTFMLMAYLGIFKVHAQQANIGTCNPAVYTPWVNGGSPAFTVTEAHSGTPLLGTWSVGIFPFNTNTSGNAINSNLTDFATGTITGIGEVSMTVSDATNTYAIGNFAGFKVNTPSFLAVGAYLYIETYNNSVLQESQAIAIQGGDFNAGFVTTKTYDAIGLRFGLGLAGSINVFHAVNAKLCAAPALVQCNMPTPLTAPTFPLSLKSGTLGVLPVGSGVTLASNTTNALLTDFATINGGTGTGFISIKDQLTDYPAGTFAGYDVENPDFVANRYGGITITTYLGGVQQEQSGVFNVLLIANSGQSLVANAPPTATGRQTVGFVASKSFDEITFGYAKILGSPTKVYSAVVDARCSGATPTILTCNTNLDFSYPSFPVSEYSGQAGGCVSTLVGQGALVSADTSDYVNFIEGVQVGCVSWVGVKNNRVGDVYPIGTFAGFETAQYGLISISVADLGTVITYLDGIEQERSTTANLIATSFVTGKKRTIGFKTTKTFDEIRYERIGVAGISTGSTSVYRVVVEKVCPGAALPCNVPTRLNKPDYPMTTYSYMVPYGVIVGCAGSLTGEEALITADPNDFALMTMVQSLGCLRYVGVKDAAGTLHPSGTYVAYEIENMSLITASLGDLQSVVTYKAGVEQERSTRGSLVTANILTGGRQQFGFVTTKDFDEVRYEEFTVITPATLQATRIYGVTVMKLCDGPALSCSTAPIPAPVAAKLNLPGAMNANVGYPVTVRSIASDAFLGVGVCTNQLLNPERVVSADTTDYATIAVSGVNCWASIAVKDEKATYPAGSFAGFDIFNSTAINLDLIGGTFITTYLDGVLQEFKTANNLLLDLIGSTGIATTSRRRVGFVTTKPFDEIKYSQGQLVGINLGSTQVYGAVVSKVAGDCAPINFTFNCGTATSTGTFTANATAGQTGTLTVPMTGVTAGPAVFTVTGAGFTGTLSTILTAGQASVMVPITYDGTGIAGSRTLTVSSSQGIGTCTPSVSVVVGVSTSPCLISLPILLPIGSQLPLPNFCTRNGYNYYKSLAASVQELLAINPNGNTFNPTSVTIDATNTGAHSVTVGGKTTALANRMVSILAPGSYTANGGMKVRIYYDSTEFAALPTANRRWFKHPAHTKAAVLADLTAGRLMNATFLIPSSTGMENGATYVEFENITSFSTFGYAASSAASFNFDCGTAAATGTFTANGTAGQTGSLTVPITNATAGDATFTVSGTGFTGTLTTTLTANQASVSVPITYDGTGAAGSRTLTVTSSEGTGSCTPSVSVVAGVTCATPTVGGTAAYGGGTLCDASNIGTAMLTGNTGNIVRWETSTNGGSTWTSVTNTNTYHNFANAANGQQYRAVVNNGSGCLDANSAVATIATSATNCTSTTCDNSTGNVTFTVVTPPSNANLKSRIIMTNSSGVIQYTSAKDSVKINGVAVGDYLVYRVVYDSTQLPLPTLSVGTNITAIGGGCTKFTNQLAYKVCPAPSGAPDLTTTIGQPMPSLSVGQPSNLPITVTNIGTASAPGVITTTITLPTGVTAPANFTSNGWMCSTTTPSVSCTNLGPIAAGRDSTFFVPITPNASTSGTNPIFNANTTPVVGETVTNNNAATPMTTLTPVVGGSLLTMKVLLQGNYDQNTGMMHDSLRKKGLIPLSDPYRTAAYNTKFTHKKNGATQTTTNAILGITGANAIVDWVFIELHDAANPATVIATKAALLQRDGDVVSAADGISPVYVDSISSGNYYVAIRHRNHLGTMTAATRSLSATSTVVDFTTLTAAQLWNKAGGDGYEQTKAGIRNLLWAGDTDGNRQTIFSGSTNDTDPVFFDVMTAVTNVNFVPNYILNAQYLASDVNMDGKVIYQSANNEVDIILFMVLSHTLNTGFLPSYIIVEQLP